MDVRAVHPWFISWRGVLCAERGAAVRHADSPSTADGLALLLSLGSAPKVALRLGYLGSELLQDVPPPLWLRLLHGHAVRHDGFRIERFRSRLHVAGNRRSATIHSLDGWAPGTMPAELDHWQAFDVAELAEAIGAVCRTLGAPRWTPPGGVASRLLRVHRVERHLPALDPPDEWREAMFGGRVEAAGAGTIRHGYGFDLRAAYPTAAADLPCLRHGVWSFRPYRPGFALGVFPVSWDVAGAVWGPFPERGPGSLRYPTSGSGRYPAPEVDAARAVYGRDRVRVSPGWVWEPLCDHQPLAWLPEVAEVSKLAANAVYGRLAQSTGWAVWQCLPWAATITGRVRAAVLRMASSAGTSARLITTDGLITSSRTTLDVPKRFHVREADLGPVQVVQSGIYRWGKGGARSRGLEVAAVPFDRLERLWRERGWSAALTVRVPLYVGPAWAAEIGWDHWRTVIESPYRIAFDPTPRRIPLQEHGRTAWRRSAPPDRWHLDSADTADAWRPPAWRNDRDQAEGIPGSSW